MKDSLLLWAPRVASFALTLFFASFALGAFSDTHSVIDLVMHLAPTLLMVGVVALGWRRPLIGGVGLLLFAALYALFTRRRPDWILVISGPLALVGLLYLASWLRTRPRQARA